MRGEYCPCCPPPSSTSGSSPRAWGIQLLGQLVAKGLRFIPTCVGNTSGIRRSSVVRPVHPHVRGEYLTTKVIHVTADGSSPRAWGILLGEPRHLWTLRFIPTCVGNTLPRQQPRQRLTVHPHVRGEYFWQYPGIDAGYGSSPRAWGILRKAVLQMVGHRFIPTCVGNTPACRACVPGAPVHPHVRGEYVHSYGIRAVFCRFIPTCVGNTKQGAFLWPLQSVHPHVRGEYSNIQKSSKASLRFIPTCVGNTISTKGHNGCDPVHPHVRGEYSTTPSGWPPGRGSSPRAWGIRRCGTAAYAPRRFIPTCVGNTHSRRTAALARTVHPHVRGEYSSRKHEEFLKVIIAAKIYRSGTA